MKILNEYLNFLQEQFINPAPVTPVQNPMAMRAPSPERVTSQRPETPKPPTGPNVKLNYDKPVKSYFNYMLWTSKIIKQGEIFRSNCYSANCSQHEPGTGDRRICKDRCDIETCKKIIAMLKISAPKCKDAKNPQLCKVRYAQLIPLYEQKLRVISSKFLKAERIQKQTKPQVG